MTAAQDLASPRNVAVTATAAVLARPGRIETQAVDLPAPGAGQVLIRLEGCGVCSSNLAPWEGAPWFDYPFPPGSPGHEGWGVVEAAGPDVSGSLAAGTRVATLSDRAYATHCLADAAATVPLPASLGEHPFPGEPLGCAMNIWRRGGIEAGQTVAIVGIGFLGALLTQLASRAGARVVAISRRSFSLEVARRAGAHETLELADAGELEGRLAELTDGTLCDRVIEATGVQQALDAASRLVRVRGRLVIAGFHQGGPRTVDMQLWNWRGIDVVNAHERDPAQYVRGIRDAVAAVEDGRLEPWPLLTHRYPLDRLGDALRDTAQRPDGFLKAIVTND